MSKVLKTIFVVLIAVVLITNACAKRKSKKTKPGMLLRQKETNPINFIRLTVMRLVYGLATNLGFEDQIGEALNGAFVPPGVDDYSDYQTLFNRDDDDYDY